MTFTAVAERPRAIEAARSRRTADPDPSVKKCGLAILKIQPRTYKRGKRQHHVARPSHTNTILLIDRDRDPAATAAARYILVCVIIASLRIHYHAGRRAGSVVPLPAAAAACGDQHAIQVRWFRAFGLGGHYCRGAAVPTRTQNKKSISLLLVNQSADVAVIA